MEHGSRSLRRLISGFYLFYLRIFIPAGITAIIIALADLALGGSHFLSILAYAYFLLAPAFQFLSYDFTNPDQYYFYNNIGFTRPGLWILNIMTSLILFLILSAI